MVIMLQTSSGKGSEADEKPYLRVRALLLITRSEAVNSADTAITGNEPAAVQDPRLHGTGMGTGMGTAEWGWRALCCWLGRVHSRWGSTISMGKTSLQTPAPSGLTGMISRLFWKVWRCEGGDVVHASPPSRKGGGCGLQEG